MFGPHIAGSQFNGNPIVGLSFEIRILLDTSQVGMTIPGLADVFFAGPIKVKSRYRGLESSP
jgi:hypothetical protein